MPTLHACQAPTCPRQVSTRYLMCREHWSLVPADLAREVYRTCGAFQNADRRVLRNARLRYQQAVDQAIASLPSPLSPPTSTAPHQLGKDLS